MGARSMIVVRPGETPCETSTQVALTARHGVRTLLDAMAAMGQPRMGALGMVLQCVLIEAGTIDVEAMEHFATAVKRNVAAALRGDQSGETLDEMIEAIEALDRIAHKQCREMT